MSSKLKTPKLFRKLGKDYILDGAPDLLTEFLRMSIQSCRLPPIRIGPKKFPLRSQIHTLLLGDFGQFKSTRLKSLPAKHSFYLQGVTSAAFFGTISKHGESHFGVVEQVAGKVLIADEVHNLPKPVRDATLALLEDQFYTRILGYRVKQAIAVESKDKLMKAEAHEGVLSVAARFSCVAGGLPLIRKSDENDWAWFSRFACLRWRGTREDVYHGLENGFDAHDLRKEVPFSEKLEVTFPDYKKMVREHAKLTERLAFLQSPGIEKIQAAKEKKKKMPPDFTTRQSGMLGRNVGEVCRMAAIFALRKNRTEINEDDWQKALSLAPLLLYNYAALDFSQVDYLMLSRIIEGESDEKIGQDLGFSPERVYLRRAEFQARGLIP